MAACVGSAHTHTRTHTHTHTHTHICRYTHAYNRVRCWDEGFLQRGCFFMLDITFCFYIFIVFLIFIVLC